MARVVQTLRDIKERLLSAAAPAPVPYFAEYAIDAERLVDKSLDLKEFSGLLVCHVIRAESGAVSVATYWLSKEHFVLSGGSFQKRVTAGGLKQHGFITDVPTKSTKTEPLLRRLSKFEIVVSIAAFLGAANAIYTQLGASLTAPRLMLKADKPRVQLIEAAEFEHKPALVNHLPVAHRDVALSASLKPSRGDAISLNVNPSSIPHMPAGTTQDLTVDGIAPVPGEYQLLLHVHAKAGFFRFADTNTLSQAVTVWPRVPAAKLSVVKSAHRETMFKGSITVGAAAPNGLDCELEIKGVPQVEDLQIYSSHLYQQPEWLKTDTPGAEVTSLRWAVLPLTGFEHLRFQVLLLHAAQVGSDKVSRNASVQCLYRKEKAREIS